VRRDGVRLSAVLRLLGLLGHGHRAGAHAGIRLPEELRFPLQGGLHYRLLATLAHLAVHLAEGLPLHPARRESPYGGADVLQSAGCDASGRILAWGTVDVPDLGGVPRYSAGPRTDAG